MMKLAILVYILIYLIRLQQGGWEIKTSLFENERIALDQKIQKYLPSPQAQLLSGIVLGEKKALPPEFRLALRDTSTLHIVVVSGQNLTLLAALIMRLSGLLTRKVSIGLTILSITGYTMLTGAEVPVLRAAVMAGGAYLAQILGKESSGVWILILVAGLFLLINPLWILDLSFQLSFLATLGVVSVAPIIADRLNWLPTFIRENLSITIAAQALVLPIIASNFYQLSLVSIIANLLVLWTIPYIMMGGFGLLILSMIWQSGATILSLFLNILLTYFVYIVQFFASLSFAWEYIGEFSPIYWVGYYLIITAVLLAISKLKLQN